MLPFLGLGLFFTVMIVRQAIASAATYAWDSVPCQILESEVRESTYPSPWFAYLRYSWSGGESLRSSRAFNAYRDAVLFTRRWPAGSRATCYADPRYPDAALLERNNAGFILLLFLPLPLLFVFIGGAGFYSAVFRVHPKPRVQRVANPIAGQRFLAGLLIVSGAVLFLVFLFGPVRHTVEARSWRAQECKIVRSEVWRHATSRGGFSPRVLYSYDVHDREHRADVYSFFEYPNNGWSAALKVTNRYRPGQTVSCYVNPSDPDEATLDRNPSLVWLLGFLPLGLLAGGKAVWPRRSMIYNR